MTYLVFPRRRATHPVVPMICLYCGGRATHRANWKVRNPYRDPPADNPAADDDRDDPHRRDDRPDPVGLALGAGILAIAAVAVWAWDRRRYRRPAGAPALVPGFTVVPVTTCRRHRWFGLVARALATILAAAVLGFLAALALGRIPPGEARTVGIVASIAGGFGGAALWEQFGPVGVVWAGRESVTLGRVRPAYFTARDRK